MISSNVCSIKRVRKSWDKYFVRVIVEERRGRQGGVAGQGRAGSRGGGQGGVAKKLGEAKN